MINDKKFSNGFTFNIINNIKSFHNIKIINLVSK